MGLSLIEGSCPEIGVLQPLDPQDGTPIRQRLSITWLARPAPLAPFRAQRAPARAGSFNGTSLPCPNVRYHGSFMYKRTSSQPRRRQWRTRHADRDVRCDAG